MFLSWWWAGCPVPCRKRSYLSTLRRRHCLNLVPLPACLVPQARVRRGRYPLLPEQYPAPPAPRGRPRLSAGLPRPGGPGARHPHAPRPAGPSATGAERHLGLAAEAAAAQVLPGLQAAHHGEGMRPRPVPASSLGKDPDPVWGAPGAWAGRALQPAAQEGVFTVKI